MNNVDLVQHLEDVVSPYHIVKHNGEVVYSSSTSKIDNDLLYNTVLRQELMDYLFKLDEPLFLSTKSRYAGMLFSNGDYLLIGPIMWINAPKFPIVNGEQKQVKFHAAPKLTDLALESTSATSNSQLATLSIDSTSMHDAPLNSLGLSCDSQLTSKLTSSGMMDSLVSKSSICPLTIEEYFLGLYSAVFENDLPDEITGAQNEDKLADYGLVCPVNSASTLLDPYTQFSYSNFDLASVSHGSCLEQEAPQDKDSSFRYKDKSGRFTVLKEAVNAQAKTSLTDKAQTISSPSSTRVFLTAQDGCFDFNLVEPITPLIWRNLLYSCEQTNLEQLNLGPLTVDQVDCTQLSWSSSFALQVQHALLSDVADCEQNSLDFPSGYTFGANAYCVSNLDQAKSASTLVNGSKFWHLELQAHNFMPWCFFSNVVWQELGKTIALEQTVNADSKTPVEPKISLESLARGSVFGLPRQDKLLKRPRKTKQVKKVHAASYASSATTVTSGINLIKVRLLDRLMLGLGLANATLALEDMSNDLLITDSAYQVLDFTSSFYPKRGELYEQGAQEEQAKQVKQRKQVEQGGLASGLLSKQLYLQYSMYPYSLVLYVAEDLGLKLSQGTGISNVQYFSPPVLLINLFYKNAGALSAYEHVAYYLYKLHPADYLLADSKFTHGIKETSSPFKATNNSAVDKQAWRWAKLDLTQFKHLFALSYEQYAEQVQNFSVSDTHALFASKFLGSKSSNDSSLELALPVLATVDTNMSEGECSLDEALVAEKIKGANALLRTYFEVSRAVSEDNTPIDPVALKEFLSNSVISSKRLPFHEVVLSDVPHNAYSYELNHLQAVTDGDPERALRALRSPMHGKEGRMGFTPLRHARNSAIINATLDARAAIRGGVRVEKAYTLADYMILMSELCQTEEEAFKLREECTYRFAELVQESQGKKSQKYSVLVNKVLEEIERSVFIRVSREDLVKCVGRNEDYVQRVFKEEVGESLMEHLRRVRIERAKELISSSEVKISEIAELLQFSSTSHFARVFKKFTGMSPAEFKEKHYQKFGKSY